MTPDTLARLKALAEAATPGPWSHYHAKAPKRTTEQDTNAIMKNGRQIVAWSGFDGADNTEKERKANAAFIAALNPETVLALLAELTRLTEREQQRVQLPTANEQNWAGHPAPADSDSQVIARVRDALWVALSRGREIGGDRSLVGLVKTLAAERDEAQNNRRGEFNLREAAEREVDRLRGVEQIKDQVEHDAKFWQSKSTANADALTAEQEKGRQLREWLRLRTISWRTDEQHKGEVDVASQALNWMDALGFAPAPPDAGAPQPAEEKP